MGITTLTENCNEQMISDCISICKSDSGISGTKLREAHYTLGVHLGKLIVNQERAAKKYSVIILMRAGLPFGLGIADGLEMFENNVRVFFSTKEKEIPDDFNTSNFDRIILADAVIESGNSILSLAEKIYTFDKTIFAANVLSNKAVSKFEKLNVYTVRVSQVSFKGSAQKNITNGKGPDTGERLFDSSF
jgi:hypothetical protein